MEGLDYFWDLLIGMTTFCVLLFLVIYSVCMVRNKTKALSQAIKIISQPIFILFYLILILPLGNVFFEEYGKVEEVDVYTLNRDNHVQEEKVKPKIWSIDEVLGEYSSWRLVSVEKLQKEKEDQKVNSVEYYTFKNTYPKSYFTTIVTDEYYYVSEKEDNTFTLEGEDIVFASYFTYEGFHDEYNVFSVKKLNLDTILLVEKFYYDAGSTFEIDDSQGGDSLYLLRVENFYSRSLIDYILDENFSHENLMFFSNQSKAFDKVKSILLKNWNKVLKKYINPLDTIGSIVDNVQEFKKYHYSYIHPDDDDATINYQHTNVLFNIVDGQNDNEYFVFYKSGWSMFESSKGLDITRYKGSINDHIDYYWKDFKLESQKGVLKGLDGNDQLIVETATDIKRFSLSNITLPVEQQDYGVIARDHLRKYIGDTIYWAKDKEDIELFVDAYSINEELIEKGYAWAQQGLSTDNLYKLKQNVVKNKRIGLWSSHNAIEPWNYGKETESKDLVFPRVEQKDNSYEMNYYHNNLSKSVWICTGKYATKYHSHSGCRGLNNCRASVVSRSTSNLGSRRSPCSICYF